MSKSNRTRNDHRITRQQTAMARANALARLSDEDRATLLANRTAAWKDAHK